MSKKLEALARSAAKAAQRQSDTHEKWVAEFARVYGHDDLSDALVEAITYGRADCESITSEFIAANSQPGCS